MTTLQVASQFNETQENHAPYLHKGRSMKRTPLLSRNLSGRVSLDIDQEESSKTIAEPGSVNLESMYFRGFRSRPLLNAQEELALATRLYQGTTNLRSLLQQAFQFTKGLGKQPEVEVFQE
ncbi:MAG: hypothetical protein CO149_02150, partial [Nitrospirae bacterium CG_4_9_14_3_um_filter_51_5]